MPGIFIAAFAVFALAIIIFVVTGFLFRGYHLKNANENEFSSHFDSTTNTNL